MSDRYKNPVIAMSGFEIAGIVLGAFPIAISALERIPQAAKLLDSWHNVRREYEQCRFEVRNQHIFYIQNLKQLLLPLAVEDDETIQHLIDDPDHPLWKEEKFARDLEDRLQDSFTAYLETVEWMQQVMQEINRELGANNDSHAHITQHTPQKSRTTFSPVAFKRRVPFGLRRRFRRALGLSLDAGRRRASECLRRFKFIIRHEVRQRLIGELRKGNQDLEKLLQNSDNISSAQKARMARGRASLSPAAMNEFWRHADGLYKALSESWDCTCKRHHRARLVLQHRASSEKEFKLLLFHGSPTPDPTTNTKWDHHCLKIVEKTRSLDMTLDSKASIPSPPRLSTCHSPQHRMNTPLRSALRARPRDRQGEPSNPRYMLLPGCQPRLIPSNIISHTEYRELQ